jgi:hypothetical protein
MDLTHVLCKGGGGKGGGTYIEVVVYLDHGRINTRAKTFDLLEREEAVGCRPCVCKQSIDINTITE